MSTDETLVELKISVALLSQRMEGLESLMARQSTILEELNALKNQGKGTIWLLVGLGTAFGTFISNIKPILTFIKG